MFASSGGWLDVTVSPGSVTQAQLPLRRRGHPTGLEEIPSGWVSGDKLSSARRRAYVGIHESWLVSIMLDTETAEGLAEEPLLRCAPADPRVR